MEPESERESGHETRQGKGREPGGEKVVRQNGAQNGALRVAPRARLSVAELRQLIRLMSTSDIAEITLEHELGGLHLTLRKPAAVVLAPAAAAAPGNVLEEADELENDGTDEAPARESERALVEVRAPLVGVFRSSMKEHGKPLVSIDENVRQGQVVAAIEALNVLNEVEVPTAGRVKEVLVSDGQPVEYGQPLLLIEPKVAL